MEPIPLSIMVLIPPCVITSDIEWVNFTHKISRNPKVSYTSLSVKTHQNFGGGLRISNFSSKSENSRNMKKLLLPFLFISGASLFAQPTITQAQFALTVGDVITSYPQTYSVPSTGASQTWNYTSFTTTSPGVSNIINSSSSTIVGLPASTLCYDPGGGTNDCYLISAGGFYRTGVGNATASIPYNVSDEQILAFPVTYGSTNVDFF